MKCPGSGVLALNIKPSACVDCPECDRVFFGRGFGEIPQHDRMRLMDAVKCEGCQQIVWVRAGTEPTRCESCAREEVTR